MEFLKKLVIVLSGALCVGLACLMAIILSDRIGKSDARVWILIFVVVLLLASVLVVICIRTLVELERASAKNQILNLQVEQEKNMYQKVTEVYDQARSMNHDIKAYLVAVLGMLENAEYEEARARIMEVVERRLNPKMVHYAASGAINAVLNEMLEYAERNDIHMEMRINGTIPESNTMEVAVILANLLDNAIEAEKHQIDSQVLLDMYEEKGMYYIFVRNRMDHSVLAENPKLQTTKEDKKLHGLGIRSVKQLVKELDGTLLLTEEAGMFCSYVSFPTQKG